MSGPVVVEVDLLAGYRRQRARHERIAAILGAAYGLEATAEAAGAGLATIWIRTPGRVGMWIAGEVNETWGAEYYNSDADYLEDPFDSVGTSCVVDWEGDTPAGQTPAPPEDVAHALAGAIWLWHRFHGEGETATLEAQP